MMMMTMAIRMTSFAQRRLTHPINSASHAVVVSSPLYIGVHARAGFSCQAPLVI